MKTYEELNSMVNRILRDDALGNVNGGTNELDELQHDIDMQLREVLEESLRAAGLSEEEIRIAMMNYDNRSRRYRENPAFVIV